MRKTAIIFLLLAVAVFLMVLEVSLGSVSFSMVEVWYALVGGHDVPPEHSYIIRNLRLPRAIMAILTGAGLSAAGLLMQTLFRNPLAGPFVLGISSGAGLGVALLVMGSGIAMGGLLSPLGMVSASMLGSFMVLSLIIFVSLRIRDTMGLLIIGLMMGSLTSALVGIMSYFTSSETLQRYVFWSLGGLGGLDWLDLGVVSTVILVSMTIISLYLKPLNLLLLGPTYASSMGINVRAISWMIILVTSLLAGCITAYAGPIAFVGLAAPHISRLFLNSVDHRILLPVSVLVGINLMLVCDLVAGLPYLPYQLPINAVTSLLGAPLVIWLILKRKRLNF